MAQLDSKGIKVHLFNLCSFYSHLQGRVSVTPTRYFVPHPRILFFNLRSCHFHCQGEWIMRIVTFASSFLYVSRPRCIALPRSACFFTKVFFRRDDACQKSFSWFFDWIRTVQKCALLRPAGFFSGAVFFAHHPLCF